MAANISRELGKGCVVSDATIIGINGGSSRYPTLGVEIAFTMAPNPKPFDDGPGDLA